MRMVTTILLVSLLAPAAAFAWNGTPEQVAGVSVAPLLVAAAPDGAYGAFAAWQEPSLVTQGAGTLRVTHLDAEGGLDPAWPPGGLVLGAADVARSVVRLLPDGSGGTFAWWMESAQLRVTRVLANGQVATGWTASGRLLGTLTSSQHRPWVELDGQGGIWLGWFQGTRTVLLTPTVRVIHLGSDGGGAGGWPSSPRSVPLSPDDDEWVYAASFARATDGGVWAIVATGHLQEVEGAAVVTPGSWRLARLTNAGQGDPSLPPEGVELAPFAGDQVGIAVPRIGLAALADDGAGGVWAIRSEPAIDYGGSWSTIASLHRYLADGTTNPAHPAPVQVGGWFEPAGGSCTGPGCAAWADYSAVLARDAAGQLHLGASATYSEIGNVLQVSTVAGDGSLAGVAAASGSGIVVHPAFDSGLMVASFDPSGPTHAMFDPAYASVGMYSTHNGAHFTDETFSPFTPAYAACDVAPLADDGAVLVWSRVAAPQGLYAVRLGANGSPLAVGPPTAAPARGLRLAREGAALRASWDGGAEGVLTLHDVAGRVRARVEVGGEAGSSVLVPGGGDAPGMYFARLVRRDGSVERARGIMLR